MTDDNIDDLIESLDLELQKLNNEGEYRVLRYVLDIGTENAKEEYKQMRDYIVENIISLNMAPSKNPAEHQIQLEYQKNLINSINKYFERKGVH